MKIKSLWSLIIWRLSIKIAVFSGSFDPLHNGHIWVINQAEKLFDQVHVMIGRNPSKYPYLKEEDRLNILKESLTGNVVCGVLGDKLVVDYANQLAKTCHVTIIRSVRDTDDFYYEHSMFKCMEEKVNTEVGFVYFHAPTDLSKLSSSNIKSYVKQGNWDIIFPCLPESSYKKLLDIHFHGLDEECDNALSDLKQMLPELYSKLKIERDKAYKLLENNSVASIFETTSAGFAPAPYETLAGFPDDDGLSMTQKASGDFDVFKIDYRPSENVDKIRSYYDKAVDAEVILPNKKITYSQVTQLLDGDDTVVQSLEFFLMKIPVDSVNCYGKRFQPHTTSVGPIVVDKGLSWVFEKPISQTSSNGHKVVMEDVVPCVIEGKHRWMDAIERGEKTIWAWVGDEVIDQFKQPS